MPRFSFTADDEINIGVIDDAHTGVAVMVETATAGGDLGTGTLNLRSRPAGETGDKQIVAALALDERNFYDVGVGTELWLQLTGSTNPDVFVDISQA